MYQQPSAIHYEVANIAGCFAKYNPILSVLYSTISRLFKLRGLSYWNRTSLSPQVDV